MWHEIRRSHIAETSLLWKILCHIHQGVQATHEESYPHEGETGFKGLRELYVCLRWTRYGVQMGAGIGATA